LVRGVQRLAEIAGAFQKLEQGGDIQRRQRGSGNAELRQQRRVVAQAAKIQAQHSAHSLGQRA
jgi:hypothetical protein